MRDVPEALVARVESGAATMCHAWIVELADETRLGFTDHDEELEVAGVPCRAGCGWTVGAGHQEVGEPGLSAASAVLDVDGPTEADIDQGRWDGARVEHWRVDWAEPELRVRLAVGTIRRLVRRGDQVIAEMEGPMAALDRVVGRTFSRLCDAVLGDGRCGVDLGAHPGEQPDWAEVGGEERLLEAARRWLVEKPVAAAEPGDVLVFRMSPDAAAKHCALMSEAGEPGKIIHAYWGRAVVDSWLGECWRRRLVAAFAFPEIGDVEWRR